MPGVGGRSRRPTPSVATCGSRRGPRHSRPIQVTPGRSPPILTGLDGGALRLAARIGDCDFHPGRTSLANDNGQALVVYGKTQSPIKKYVPDRGRLDREQPRRPRLRPEPAFASALLDAARHLGPVAYVRVEAGSRQRPTSRSYLRARVRGAEGTNTRTLHRTFATGPRTGWCPFPTSPAPSRDSRRRESVSSWCRDAGKASCYALLPAATEEA